MKGVILLFLISLMNFSNVNAFVQCEVFKNDRVVGELSLNLIDFRVRHEVRPRKCGVDINDRISVQTHLTLNGNIPYIYLRHIFSENELTVRRGCEEHGPVTNQLSPISGTIFEGDQNSSIAIMIDLMWKGDIIVGTDGFLPKSIRISSHDYLTHLALKNCKYHSSNFQKRKCDEIGCSEGKECVLLREGYQCLRKLKSACENVRCSRGRKCIETSQGHICM
jgi:hypothetical protein